MPSEKILSEKQAYVAALREKLMNSVAGVVVEYKGISVADDTKLRAELRAAGVEYAVVKNTMLRLAIKDSDLAGMTCPDGFHRPRDFERGSHCCRPYSEQVCGRLQERLRPEGRLHGRPGHGC